MKERQFRSCDAVTSIDFLWFVTAFPRESHSRKIRSKNKSVYENTVELHAPTHGLLTVTNSRVSFCCQNEGQWCDQLPTHNNKVSGGRQRVHRTQGMVNRPTETKRANSVPYVNNIVWTTKEFFLQKNKKYKSLNERKQIKGKAELEYGCYMKGCVQQWWLGLNPKKNLNYS